MSKKTNKPIESSAPEKEAVVGTPDLEAVVAAEEEKKAAAAKAAKPVKKFNIRNFKHGTLSVVLTLVFVGVLILVNVIVGMVSERFDTSADLSAGGMYTIDEKTENFVAELDHDVKITVLNSESNFEAMGTIFKQVNEIIKKLEVATEHITIDYLLLDQNPNFSSRFTGETLEENYIVVECPDTGRHRIISAEEYITVDQEAYYSAYQAAYYSGAAFNPYDYYYSNIEQEAVSAMMYVANDELVRIAFTEGYGELDSTALSNLLRKNGYEVEKVNLTQVESIDPEIDFVVMFAPTMDVDNDNLTKLDSFLDNGGKFGKNVVYFASVQQPETPNIDAFLSDWGMSVARSVIVQSDTNYVFNYYSDMGVSHVQNILDTNYAGELYGNSLYTYGSKIRPVVQLWENGSKGNVEQEIIMQSYDNAYLFPIEADENFTLDEAEKGIFNDAIVAYRVHSTTQSVSRLAVFGSDMLVNSYFMEYANSNNGTFIVNMFNYICGREEGITITPKSFAVTGFDMNAGTANVLAVVLCIIIPVIVITLGIVIWVRRRHR